jgi:hypothetical protein
MQWCVPANYVKPPLLPLDGAWWFRRDVVDDAVDASDFGDDAAGDATEDFVGEGGPVGGHAVFGFYGADGAGVGVGALVAHDSDGFNGEQDGEALPDFAVEAGAFDFGGADGVGFLEDGDAVGGDFAEDADGEAGAGEGLALKDVFGHMEVAADAADFVLE